MSLEKNTIDGIEVRVWSKGEGRPLVFLHGFAQHLGEAPFLRRLAETRRVVAPEHPGYGETGGFEQLHDLTDLVLRYRVVIESLVDGPADLIGHSLGGMFAAEIAAQCPDLVRRLVLVDSYGLWLDEHPLPDLFVMQPPQMAAALWHTSDPAKIDEMKSRHLQETDDNLAQNIAVATKFMWPIPDRGLSRRLRYIKAPTLVLHGADDGLIPWPYAEALARGIPGAEARSIAGAGHLPMIEAEDAFLRELGAFLD